MERQTDKGDCPLHFKYKDALAKGKPSHGKFDAFSIRHPAMPLEKRAKIFSPFDALKGFHEAIAAKEDIYVEQKELTEEDARRLDLTLRVLQNMTYSGKTARESQVEATVTYFIPCPAACSGRNQQGTYETVTGTVLGVDAEYTHLLILDCMEIRISDIIDIKSPMLDALGLNDG